MARDSWTTVRIGDLCVGIYDGPHATPKKTTGGAVFLGISNLVSGRLDLGDVDYLSEEDFVRWTRGVTPQAGDVVFSYETRLGEAAQVPEGLRLCLGRRMALMRPDPSKVAPRYLLYAYLGPEFQETIRTRAVPGSTVDRIPLIEFPNFPIRVPPLSEQTAVADLLGALDDKIELNRRMNETLEALFRATFNQRLGEVAGSEGCFGDVAENVREGIEPSSLPPDTPYIGLEHMPRRSIALADWAQAAGLGSGKHRFRRGEILFGKLRPYFHKVGVAPVDGICSTDILVIKPKEPQRFSLVLGLAFSDDFVAHADATSGGTKMPRTSWRDLARYPITIPSEAASRELTELTRPLIDRIVANVHESGTLAQLRDALLPKLISGEIRVRTG